MAINAYITTNYLTAIAQGRYVPFDSNALTLVRTAALSNEDTCPISGLWVTPYMTKTATNSYFSDLEASLAAVYSTAGVTMDMDIPINVTNDDVAYLAMYGIDQRVLYGDDPIYGASYYSLKNQADFGVTSWPLDYLGCSAALCHPWAALSRHAINRQDSSSNGYYYPVPMMTLATLADNPSRSVLALCPETQNGTLTSTTSELGNNQWRDVFGLTKPRLCFTLDKDMQKYDGHTWASRDKTKKRGCSFYVKSALATENLLGAELDSGSPSDSNSKAKTIRPNGASNPTGWDSHESTAWRLFWRWGKYATKSAISSCDNKPTGPCWTQDDYAEEVYKAWAKGISTSTTAYYANACENLIITAAVEMAIAMADTFGRYIPNTVGSVTTTSTSSVYKSPVCTFDADTSCLVTLTRMYCLSESTYSMSGNTLHITEPGFWASYAGGVCGGRYGSVSIGDNTIEYLEPGKGEQTYSADNTTFDSIGTVGFTASNLSSVQNYYTKTTLDSFSAYPYVCPTDSITSSTNVIIEDLALVGLGTPLSFASSDDDPVEVSFKRAYGWVNDTSKYPVGQLSVSSPLIMSTPVEPYRALDMVLSAWDFYGGWDSYMITYKGATGVTEYLKDQLNVSTSSVKYSTTGKNF